MTKPIICVATGTRAEYGLLYPLLDLLRKDTDFELQIIATAAHLSTEFGMTITEIEKDGFVINERIEMLLSSDTDTAVVKSMGLAMISAADVFKRLQPDVFIVLGDRFEMLALVTSAYLMGIPVAHISGGEVTEGAFDEGIRHSITKMSSLHFAATDVYRNRILQLGENPDSVYNVGAIGLDNIRHLPLYEKQELEQTLGLTFNMPTVLITFHAVTIANESAHEQFAEVLQALSTYKTLQKIFTLPNCDTGGREIIEMIQQFVAKTPHAFAFTNLGQKRYLSTLQHVDMVIGNSSSGIIEVPFMKIPTVNIGDRQKGRLMGESIINVPCKAESIVAGIRAALQMAADKVLDNANSPYGDGTAAQQMLAILKENVLTVSTRKAFFDTCAV